MVSNETNGIEPPRDYLSIKKSKKGPLKQIVPSYQVLQNFYTLLWDMKDNDGYIKVVAVMQKFFDQGGGFSELLIYLSDQHGHSKCFLASIH